MSYLKAIISAAVVALAIIFMIQNIGPLSQPLSIRLSLMFIKFESTPYPVYLIILLAFFVGLLLASVLGLADRYRMRKLLAAGRKEVDTLNRELDSLRNLPITSQTLPGTEEINGLMEPNDQETVN